MNQPFVIFLRCRDTELNCGHEDFQSSALPTELSRHVVKSLITFPFVMVKMKIDKNIFNYFLLNAESSIYKFVIYGQIIITFYHLNHQDPDPGQGFPGR